MKFLLLLFALLTSIHAGPPMNGVPMPPFGNEMLAFVFNEPSGTDVDSVRVGCFLLYCHIDDAGSCVHTRHCDCRVQCTKFSHIYTRDNMRPKTESVTIWKERKECVNEFTVIENRFSQMIYFLFYFSILFPCICPGGSGAHGSSMDQSKATTKECPEGFTRGAWCYVIKTFNEGLNFKDSLDHCSSLQNSSLPIVYNIEINQHLSEIGLIFWLGLICQTDGTCESSHSNVGINLDGRWIIFKENTKLKDVVCMKRVIQEEVESSPKILWIILACLLALFVIFLVILFPFRKSIFALGDEELCLEQIMEQLCNTPESDFVQAEIIIRDDAKFVQARPSDVYLWSLELTPNRSDLCRFIIQSSQGQTGRAAIRTYAEPFQYLSSSCNGNLCLSSDESSRSSSEECTVTTFPDGLYGFQSWTGHWMGTEGNRVTTRKDPQAFWLEEWDKRPSKSAIRHIFLAFLKPFRTQQPQI